MLIKGIDVAYLHSAEGSLGQWYLDTFELQKGYWDAHWQELKTEQGSRFAVDVTGYPRSPVEKQAVMLSFLVEDIYHAVHELAGRGVRFYPSAEQAVFDAGLSLVATFEDPDGNWMQLSQRK